MTAIIKLAESFAQVSQGGAKITLAGLQAEGLVPASLEEAMAVQKAFAEKCAGPVAGWKLAIRPDGEAVAAPMFDCCRVNDVNVASFPLAGRKGLKSRYALRSLPIFPPRLKGSSPGRI